MNKYRKVEYWLYIITYSITERKKNLIFIFTFYINSKHRSKNNILAICTAQYGWSVTMGPLFYVQFKDLQAF